jgi:hypothetical protein
MRELIYAKTVVQMNFYCGHEKLYDMLAYEEQKFAEKDWWLREIFLVSW